MLYQGTPAQSSPVSQGMRMSYLWFSKTGLPFTHSFTAHSPAAPLLLSASSCISNALLFHPTPLPGELPLTLHALARAPLL